jgi:hypothetical protein
LAEIHRDGDEKQTGQLSLLRKKKKKKTPIKFKTITADRNYKAAGNSLK